MIAVVVGHGPFGDAGLAAAAIIVVAVAYAAGASRYRSSARRRRRSAAFAVGAVALVAALATPLERLADERFSAHMAQHLLLTVVAGPALAFAAVPQMLGSLAPPAMRRPLHHSTVAARWRAVPRRYRAVVAGAAALAHVVVLAVWHLPKVYEAALANELVHWLQHATMLWTAVALWAAVLTTRRSAPAGAVAALFATSVAGVIVGALITFAGSPLYEPYATAAGSDALADQQLAGVLMWVPGGIAYLVGAVIIVAGCVTPPTSRRSAVDIVPAATRPIEVTAR